MLVTELEGKWIVLFNEYIYILPYISEQAEMMQIFLLTILYIILFHPLKQLDLKYNSPFTAIKNNKPTQPSPGAIPHCFKSRNFYATVLAVAITLSSPVNSLAHFIWH